MVLKALDVKFDRLVNAIEGKLAREESRKSNKHKLAIPKASMASSCGVGVKQLEAAALPRKIVKYCAIYVAYQDTPRKTAGTKWTVR